MAAAAAPFWLPVVDLEHLLNLIPLSLEQDPDSDIPRAHSSPITFYDKHLDDSLILKKVKLIPSLISTMSEKLDEYVSTFNSKHSGSSFRSHLLFLSPEFYQNSGVVKNATDVVNLYTRAGPLVQAASLLTLHPDRPELETPFIMDCGPLFWEKREFLSEQYSLGYKEVSEESLISMMDSWDQERKETIISMRRCLPELAIWETYALSGRSILEDMPNLSAFDIFPWKKCGASGHRQFLKPPLALVPDVSKYLWEAAESSTVSTVPAQADAALPRRSGRLKSRSRADNSTLATRKKSVRPSRKEDTPKITVPKSGRQKSRYRANTADFIQRAWARAVQSDSTFIIFDCGNFLRVGIRCRENQTLYISNLIDVRTCSNPVFGKLMVSIHAAILHDAFKRFALLDVKPNHASVAIPLGRKHARDDDDTPAPQLRRSRRKLEVMSDEVAPERIIAELHERRIALLYFRHGNHHSSAPSFFKRPKSLGHRRSYSYDECLTVLLGKKLGQGAIGAVYEAQIEVDMPSGSVAHHSSKVIVKLAFSREHADRLRHEYSIYRRLSHGPVRVENIPTAFGFFEDVESDAGALILSHNGKALAYRSDPPGSGIDVSSKERAILLQILENIHAAGVAHGDIRSWNMVVDDDGKLSIIDFDRAKYKGAPVQMEAERERLEGLLDGADIDGYSVTSYAALTPSDDISY
ncbi:hypothetical protein EDD18DRAFT_79072 [Armillaria luteobubalina]|uniref:Protein kinase domain-containing protein n=1 Tax=Armillaria luteobubalina TaxID=153913 RepID=A0AA39Q8D7_9AGAR|nr:hypothetical protein EDD18DRAFT_79072 [Armillaria luteobubalina]